MLSLTADVGKPDSKVWKAQERSTGKRARNLAGNMAAQEHRQEQELVGVMPAEGAKGGPLQAHTPAPYLIESRTQVVIQSRFVLISNIFTPHLAHLTRLLSRSRA